MHEEEFSGLKLKSFRVIETESIFSGGIKNSSPLRHRLDSFNNIVR